MKTTRNLAFALAAWWLTGGVVFGSYFFLHYSSQTGPFTPIAERFDLSALPNGAIPYFISQQGPVAMAPGDSLESVVSQVRLAASTWSSVPTSALRLQFGGISAADTLQSKPGVDVIFDEMPPGIIAMGGPTVRADVVPSTDTAGAFVPILRSVLVLQSDLAEQASSSDAFFLTLAHEMGHALGLQHTMTSSVMSTAVTRATTKARPLAADDVAGISLLYPAAGYGAATASISGRVTLADSGVHLASVVALNPNGDAVSALADPDGYYAIRGLAPGPYYLYAHPLPPAVQEGFGPADIVLPVDLAGNRFAAGPVFDTQFYPGAKSVAAAQLIQVNAGDALTGYDFAVGPHGPLQLYDITTYSFPAQVAVKPAFLNVNGTRNFLVASGWGLIQDNAVVPGLSVDVTGDGARVAPGGVLAYPYAPTFLQVSFQFDPNVSAGPRHLTFTRDGDLYVLPAGLTLVQGAPPSIASVTPSVDTDGNAVATVAGTNLTAASRILFDGLPASILSADEQSGSLVVAPPQGSDNHQAVVTALNADAQTSMFVDAAAPPLYTYGALPAGVISVTPAVLPAGVASMVEISGAGTNFIGGQTVAGFGTSDVVVRRMWVLGPGKIWANVEVAATAPVSTSTLTVATGFQILTQPLGFQVSAANPQIPFLNARLINPITGQPSIYSGGQALLEVANMPGGVTAVGLSVGSRLATVRSVSNGQVLFDVPYGLPAGPAILRVNLGGVMALPIVVVIDPAPPTILGVTPAAPLDPAQGITPGAQLVLSVKGLADPGIAAQPWRVHVNVGGIDHVATSVTQSEADPRIYFVTFTLAGNVPPGDDVPVTVTIDYRTSQPAFITIQAPPQS